ncbi:autotransporter outer membrane beta-barrel domain-containing protein [Erythrobacter alti]|uniref:autotransporter outer membrane beta-barrel domain-containing protein n=1 Tax=Erythrobacter alti TaxID=1896145 RepID=UPI0030F42792
MLTKKTQLALGVASAALVSGISTPAMAACDVDGSNVTCTADSTAAEVNAALAAAGGSDVTLEIVTDANVTQPGSTVFVPQQGEVAVQNDGDVGTDAARVGVLYFGDTASAANTFDLANTGLISDRVEVYNVGGDMTFSNSGMLGNGISVFTSSEGNISFTSTGDIDSDFNPAVELSTRGDIDVQIDGDVGTAATATDASDLRDVNLFSQQFVSSPTETTTETVGTTTTTTTTSGFTIEGGAIAVALGADANTGRILAVGNGDVSVDIDGAVGSSTEVDEVQAFSGGTDQVRTQISVSDGTDSSFSDTTETTATGGRADVNVGATGTVSGTINASGFEGAEVSIDGVVGNADTPANVFVNSSGSDSLTVNSGSTVGTVSTSTFESSNTNVGGVAAVSVGETGAITGGVSANGVGGADVSVDGTVGLADNTSFIDANSSYTDTASEQESVFDSATGENSFTFENSSQSTGGDASVSIGDAGVANASVSAFANGDASVSNAGTVTQSVFATSQGTASSNGQTSTNDGAGNSTFSSFSQSEDTGGNASVDNAAGGLIGLDANSPITVAANGDASATVTNAGRINGNVDVFAEMSMNDRFNASSFTSSTDAATGVVTSVSESSNGNSFTNLGGDAEFANAAGGLVTGSVSVRGAGSASVTNEGAVIGTTYAESRAFDTEFASESLTTNVFVPGVDGGRTITTDNSSSYSEATSGGDVTGVYAGTNGAVQFAPPFGGASDGSVTQSANGDSSAIVSGTIFGSFNGNASGNEYSWNYVNSQESVFDADGDQRSFNRSYVYDETNTQSDSNSTLVVDGGLITGSASLYATGSADAQIGNGGEIEGNLSVTAQGFGGYDYSETYDVAVEYDEDGVFVGRSEDYSRELQRFVNDGDVSVAIGEGTVGGSVFLNGAGGSNTFSLSQEGTVGGQVSQTSQYSAYGFTQTTLTDVIAGATGNVTVQDIDYSETNTASGGDVSALVEGTIGVGDQDPLEYGDVSGAGGNSLSLFTDAGNADATVTGQVRNGISVRASGSDTSYDYQQTSTNGVVTAYSEQRSTQATGGTASLVVDASDRDVPANFGDVVVIGRSGSSVDIGADSSVLASTNGGYMQVGDYFSDTTSTRDDMFTGTSVTGRMSTFTSTIVGGDSSLVNNGRIGYDGGASFNGDDSFVLVLSPTSAEATNNGELYGSIAVESLFEDYSESRTSSEIGEITQVDVTDRTYAANGGSATLTNNGLVTGDASVAAVDGLVVNNGVLRGDLTLGASVDNYTTQSTDTFTQLGEEEVLDLAAALEQGYAVEQNGLLGGTIFVEGAFGNIDDSVQTSNIVADIDLNAGSVTGGGVIAEYDEETGERFTMTNVNLNGSGYLGLGETAIDQLGDSFGDVDPQIALMGDLWSYAGGARVLGVDTVTKTGSGVFLITGTDFAPASNTNSTADYTFDVGTFAITGGEIQLATASDGVFGIRGNTSNQGSLVLGSRVTLPAPLFGTNASVSAIDGVEVYQNGNFVQSGSGTLTLGITPTLVRVTDPAFSSVSLSTNPLAVQEIPLGSGLFTTPEHAFGQAFADLGTSFLTVDGDLNLGGTVQLVSPTGGLFTDGQTVDIASVSGSVTANAGVVVNSASNFVTFDLATRNEGGRTIVFASADRAGFETVGDNQNSIAAGTALSQALPDVVATIRAGSAGGIGANGNAFVLAQDLANIFVAFDTLLTEAEVTTALNELASGEFYGSLTTLETTAPFVDAISTRRVPQGASGFNVWFAPSGDFVEIEGDSAVGSSDIDADNYGGSAGFGVATGNGEIGLGFGYGRIDADARGGLLTTQADTWMVGAYLNHAIGNFGVGADLVYGWTDWNASRVMPTMSRTAFAEFDSTELRGDLRVDYTFDFGGGWVAPFGQVSFRKFDLDGFTEEGAGAVSLVVGGADETSFTPTLGLKAGTAFQTGLATLRPELTVSYSFDDDYSTHRDVAFLGAQGNSFRLQGVDPEGYFTIGAGLFADIAANSGAFLRGSYSTGGNLDIAGVNAGVTIGF